ncbi:isopeptide-forming domain-containing fimbrial protein [Butyrivibrio sp. TB]|uniref:isopeptide-forming domain-containing fimbrial protein n=1 Tax=Butyrivibrio sp. TB TaxID=1520809 RepID=UPI0008C4DA00|nr:isopeptide-forming domain-containing fimbrial protein [Butyrivibrio sp. TB]SEP75657.1 LPXTG-motif cell wall anchor domain-containing protein/fimbrial isopeptide formation D2 domain-containing protein [Butyrivibrio sp. TB]
MKRFKALLTGILTAALLGVTVTGSITANAQENAGSITVTGTTKGETYTAYEVLEYTAVDETLNKAAQFTDTHGTYKVTEEWVDFFTGSEYGLSSFITNYDGEYYVTGVTDANSTAFASAIQTGSIKYIASHTNLTVAGQEVADGSTVTISNLPYGYYVIDSSLGAVNSTGLTSPSVSVEEKNVTTPAPEKEVQENSKAAETFSIDESNGWGEWNDGQIGDTVTFKTKVTLLPKTTNVVLHDTMDATLSYNKDVVVYYAADATGSDVTDAVKAIASVKTDGNGFTVSFDTSYTENLTNTVFVTVVYSAKITQDAQVNKGQLNDTYVSYGNDGTTEHDRTYTYTYDINIIKQDENGAALDDTHFNLLAADGKTVLKVVNNSDGVYTLAADQNADNVTDDIVTSSEGKIKINGLDTGVYYLRETQAKAGYNMLTDDIKISISGTVDSANNTAVGTISATYGEDNAAKIGNVSVKNNTLYVVNTTGAYLPSTGGVGTTMFYLVGGALILMAVAAFIVKRKAAV